MSDPVHWSLIAHGGAKSIEPQEEQCNRAGLHEAIMIGSRILSEGGTALEAVEEVVKKLENDPAYNAGLYGAVRNEEGNIELTASIMDGATLDIGAVAGLKNIEHPVSVARALLRDKAIFLIGEGAMRFAQSQGFEQVSPPAAAKKATECDTVGCVARDKQGNLAAATSTGGLSGTRVGRVGDVPLPGCGFYADNKRGAISCSGEGEAIARVLLASECLHYFKAMSSNEAAEYAIKLLDKVKGEAGIIGITAEGHLTWAHNSPGFAVGMAWEESPEPKVYLKKGAEYA
ncbi:MAG TPA: isoaspartyl peptidase/L-asparaginase family protein [Rickettsiales bacterium]|nr:isoaspartyl peptidase/L-asparaginase family protein [Rickettsiales bacterium]